MRAILSLILVLGMSASACSRPEDDAGDGGIDVVTSLYPLAYAAERVGGDGVTVTDLTPPGGEAHDLELAPDDLERLAGADLVVLVGHGFQPAVEDAVETTSEALVVDAAEGVEPPAVATPAIDADDHDHDDDPHVWLDPMIYADVVDRVAGAVGEIDPAAAEQASARAARLRAQLESLDRDFRAGLDRCATRVMYTSHAAFGYLADAYGLEQRPLAGLSPEAEPDPARLAELAAEARSSGATTVFTEPTESDEVARTLAAEAGLDTAPLSPLEALTDEQATAGEDYLSVMRSNLDTLRAGLGCD